MVKLFNPAGKSSTVTDFDQKTVFSVADDFPMPAIICGDRGCSAAIPSSTFIPRPSLMLDATDTSAS